MGKRFTWKGCTFDLFQESVSPEDINSFQKAIEQTKVFQYWARRPMGIRPLGNIKGVISFKRQNAPVKAMVSDFGTDSECG